MHRRAFVILWSFPLFAQVPSGEFSVSGTVANAKTGEPIKNALVTLHWGPLAEDSIADGRGDPGRPAIHTMTGEGGEFRINGLSRGEYQVLVQKPGFTPELPGDRSGRKTIKVTSSVSNVQLKISPFGVIEGRVTDQNGEPQKAISVQLIQVHVADGTRTALTSRSVATDDRGMYRMWNLQPGRYYVRAAGRIGGTFRYVGDAPPSYISGWEGFAPVYSGGAHDLASAAPVTVESGSQLTADLELKTQPVFRIRGVVSGMSGSDALVFHLLQGEDDIANRAAVNTNGKFEVQDVVPGSYTLRITQGQQLRGETQVSVKGEDVDGVSVDLAPGVDVRAIVHVPAETASTPNVRRPAGLGLTWHTSRAQCQLSIRATQWTAAMIPFQVEANWEFVAKDVFPGQYQLHATCYGSYPISLLSGSADLMANPVISVQAGVSPPPIEITLKSGGATIDGKIEATPVPPATAGVLLVPASNTAIGLRMIPLFAVGADPPLFKVPQIAPGEYTLYLFSQRDEIEYRNPEFLRSLTGGVHVRLADGETQQVTLPSFVK